MRNFVIPNFIQTNAAVFLMYTDDVVQLLCTTYNVQYDTFVVTLFNSAFVFVSGGNFAVAYLLCDT